MTSTSALPLALIQLEVPPAEVTARIGEQPRWFIEALGLLPDDYVIVRPHLGESRRSSIGSAARSSAAPGRWSPITPTGASVARRGYGRR